jgi:hypothetical protein
VAWQKGAYRLTLLQIILQSETLCIQVDRAPVPDFVDATLSDVLLRPVQSQKLAEARIRAQSLLQTDIAPERLHRIREGTQTLDAGLGIQPRGSVAGRRVRAAKE